MADRNIKGITIEIGGNTTKLQTALKDVNKVIRTTNADLRDINKLLKLDPGNTTLLQQKQEALANAIQATKEKLDKERQALEQLKANNDTGEVTEQQRALEREIVATEQSLQGLENEYRDFGSVARQQVQAAADKIGEVGEKMKSIGSAVSQVGDKLTMGITVPLVAAGTAAAKSFADVDKTMQLVNKTMGNTSAEAERLNTAMEEAAANSTFGMSDAATATLNFARAGLSAAEAAEALAPAMNLAAGSGGDLDTVSAGLVATINSFGDSFESTSTYADIFAAACNNSALDVNSLASSLSIAAPIFASAGYSIEDAALYMGVMANAGISAEEAATALKTGLARLAKPTAEATSAMKKYGIEIFNADGTIKDSISVQKQLNAAFAGMTEQEQLAAAAAIFGKNQMSKWLALINTAPSEVDALSNSLKTASGTTQEMADAMMSGFGGSIEKLKSSLDVLKTSMGGLIAEMIMPLVEKIQSAVDAFNEMDDAQKQQIIKIAAMVAAIGPLLSVGGRLISGIGTILTFIPKITTAIMGMNPVIAAAVAVVGLLTAAYIKMATYEVEVVDHTDLLTDEQKELAKTTKSVLDVTKQSADAYKKTEGEIKANKDMSAKLVEELKKYTDESGNVVAEQDRVKQIVGELNALMPELNLAYNEQTQALSMNTSEIEKNIDAILRKAEAAAIEERLTEIMKERIEINRQMASMETAVAEAEAAATEAANAYNAELERSKGMTFETKEAMDEERLKLEELDKARQDAAVVCSEVTGDYYALKDSVTALGDEESYLTGQIGSTTAAMSAEGEAVNGLAGATAAATAELSESWSEAHDGIVSSIKGQISVFDEYTQATAHTKDEILKNMQDQVKGVQEWSDNLQELARKGISDGLLQELAKMGPEGAGYVAAFNEMSGAELQEASRLFEEATKLPEETLTAVEENYKMTGQYAYKGFKGSLEEGKAEAQDYTKTTFEDIGKDIPEGMKNGVEESADVATSAIEDLSEDVIDSAEDTLQVHSPSRVFQGIGENTVHGMAQGIRGKISEAVNAIRQLAQVATSTASATLNANAFRAYGMSVGEGVAQGILASLPQVEAAVAQIIAAANRAKAAAASVGTGAGAGVSTGASNNSAGFNATMANTVPGVTNNSSVAKTTNNNYNMGGVNFEIVAAPGQDANDIAVAVEDMLVNQLQMREGAFA